MWNPTLNSSQNLTKDCLMFGTSDHFGKPSLTILKSHYFGRGNSKKQNILSLLYGKFLMLHAYEDKLLHKKNKVSGVLTLLWWYFSSCNKIASCSSYLLIVVGGPSWPRHQYHCSDRTLLSTTVHVSASLVKDYKMFHPMQGSHRNLKTVHPRNIIFIIRIRESYWHRPIF